MSSILTNTSSMVALQTLKSISMDLAKTQDMISTGKKISTAKDNAAIWSISKVMESDVKGFTAISDSLNLGLSTVAVARNAGESVRDMLQEIKTRVVAAQEENVDRAKLQTEVVSLREQIEAIVGSAQFNGLNLLSNTDTTAGSGTTSVLASLNRNSSGQVTASEIAVSKADLGTTTSAVGTLGTNFGTTTVINAGASGLAYSLDNTNAVVAGQSYSITAFGAAAFSTAVTYVARDGESFTEVRAQLITRLNFQAASDGLDFTFSAAAGNDTDINLQNDTATNFTGAAANAAQDIGTNADGTIGGGLELLSDFDVSTEDGAAAALTAIDSLIDFAINAAADFGTVEKRVEIQSDFVSKLVDSLKTGIGALVDTDMEAASAQLQALQVQQQLGVQALSIANQAPQTILSLFQ